MSNHDGPKFTPPGEPRGTEGVMPLQHAERHAAFEAWTAARVVKP